MKTQALLALLIFILAPFSRCQEGEGRSSPKIEFASRTQEQLTRRIFAGEREMIAGIRNTSPLLETYFQSLWPSTKDQSPIDDAYFLSKVDFARGYKPAGGGRRGYQTFLFGGTRESRKVQVNNGERWEQNPDGFLDMLFVDLEAFDADTYRLRYLQNDTWSGRICLVFSVIPKMPHLQGQFEGQIWVETSALKIVRIKGTFTPPRSPKLLRRIVGGGTFPIYLSFDSVRTEVAPGSWLPSYSYFDETRTWRQIDRDAETDIRYRGHIFIWGYQDFHPTNDEMIWDHKPDEIVRLETDRVLARPGSMERTLTAIARRIVDANGINLPEVECRVLLTTPIEIFSTGNTIVLSRGLLNILPDESIIPVLLAHEIANMAMRESGAVGDSPSKQRSVDRSGIDNFENSSTYRSSVTTVDNWKTTLAFVERAGYSNGADSTSSLSLQLAKHSKQIPNLTLPRFSPSLTNLSRILPQAAPPQTTTSVAPLVLRGKYTIDAWTGTLSVQHEPIGDDKSASLLF